MTPPPHDSPYPTADRVVTFSEMTYHLGFIHDDIKDIKALLSAAKKEEAAAARWRWGLFVAAATSAASLFLQIRQ